jgi:Uma2 family endonuclease
MDMALAIPHYTIRDLDSFPDDGHRYELLDGWLLVTPAPAPGHQIVVSRLATALSIHVRECGARVYTPGSVEIEPKVHLEPDILVVPASEPIAKRWSEIRVWWLAVEVSGRGSQVYDRDFKYGAYSALGVRDVWRVDLRDRCVVVRTGAGAETTHEDRFEWHPAEIECPLAVDVQSLFDEVQGDS